MKLVYLDLMRVSKYLCNIFKKQSLYKKKDIILIEIWYGKHSNTKYSKNFKNLAYISMV